MLRINERPSGDVMVLDLRGTMTTGVPEIEFGNEVRNVLFRGYRKILVNLAGATSSDPSGVSAFLGALIDVNAVGAELRLVHVTRRIADLGIIVALYRYFQVFESEREAMASFGAEPAAERVRGKSRLEPAAAI